MTSFSVHQMSTFPLTNIHLAMSPSMTIPPPPPPSATVNNPHVSPPHKTCGILHKWVNCGQGWKPRWFLLQDGVLSYYKIHNPNKNIVSKQSDHRKPLGELHLKVSSILESTSDDKRFAIFTGTKRLHLRSKTRDDQMEWVEALKAVKRMFPRMSNDELMNSISSITVPTNKLRTRLVKAGVNEEIIQDAEMIMEIEFSEMKDELVLVRRLVIDTLGTV